MKQMTIGIGLTGDCNYNCTHCYSSKERGRMLPFEYLEKLVSTGLISSVNFGTGESILYPRFREAVSLFASNNIKVGLTTNGTTVAALDEDCMRKFNDIDFSLDFPSSEMHDSLRGIGAYENVLDGINRCQIMGIPCSLAMCLSKQNRDYSSEMLRLAADLDVYLRINIYKGTHPQYRLSNEQFWQSVTSLINRSYIVSCSEPVILPLLPYKSLNMRATTNALSVRIRPDGMIMPCVYWETPCLTLSNILHLNPEQLLRKLEEYDSRSQKHLIPAECVDCKYCDTCKGGCACRRQYKDIKLRDEYCVLLNSELPVWDYSYIESDTLVHADYLCTIIVKGGRYEN